MGTECASLLTSSCFTIYMYVCRLCDAGHHGASPIASACTNVACMQVGMDEFLLISNLCLANRASL